MEIIGIALFIITGFYLLWTIHNILGWAKIKPGMDQNAPDGGAQVDEFGVHAGKVSILVPARNEEENIPALLESCMQQGPEVKEILVLNDQSTDRTGDVVREYEKLDPRIRCIDGVQRPPGWFGKTWAGKQLADQSTGEWMVYLDADVKLAPGAVLGLLSSAKKYNLTYLSAWPHFETKTFAEHVGVPMLNFVSFIIISWPLMRWWMHNALIISSGACMLMHRAAYRKIGGHKVPSKGLLEDHAFAREWRRRGERSLTLDGQDVVSVRMYRDANEIIRGFQKNLYKALRGPVKFWGFILSQLGIFLLPFILAAVEAFHGFSTLWATGAVVNILVMRLLLAAGYRTCLKGALLHPFGVIGMVYVALLSWYSIHTGKGVNWKGRTYFTENAAKRAPIKPSRADTRIA